jgi:hypothetical protein
MRDPRQKHDKHLVFIRTLPCLICKVRCESEEAAHIRMKDPEIAKPSPGGRTKPHDFYVVPLCGQHHRDQHAYPGGERAFWDDAGIDPIKKAMAIFLTNGDYEQAVRIIEARG